MRLWFLVHHNAHSLLVFALLRWTGPVQFDIAAPRGVRTGEYAIVFTPWTSLTGGPVIVQIFVRDNNVDQALKALKKKMQREGTFREMKRRNYYEKPSEKRARQKAEALRRARKLARKRAIREGLIAGK